MKFIKAENIFEWIGLKTNWVPVPILYGGTFGIISRVVFTSMQMDIFEAAKDSPVTIDEIAQRTGLNQDSLKSVMNILTMLDYLKYKKGKFTLTRMTRKWCLKDSRYGYYSAVRFDEIMCNWMDHLPDYLKTGQGIDVHNSMREEEWQSYQINMEYLAKWTARGTSKTTPMPEKPTEMLDIGGSHGLYSIELCKKYPTLNATILDLPSAVEKARPILEKNYSGDKIKYWAGDALKDDLGKNKYDLILMSHLMHHFSAEENTEISRKIASALKPGGFFVIQEYIRPKKPSRRNMTQIISDIVYNITSSSQVWSLDQLKDYQEKAGLSHCKVNRYMISALTQVCAKKA